MPPWRGAARTTCGGRRSAFEQAIQRDERYAPAHAGLAQALVQLAAGGAERAEQVLPLAVTHADRAIELDPAQALGWQALAQAEVQWTRDWPRAEMHYRRAVALAPRTEAPAAAAGRVPRWQPGVVRRPWRRA